MFCYDLVSLIIFSLKFGLHVSYSVALTNVFRNFLIRSLKVYDFVNHPDLVY